MTVQRPSILVGCDGSPESATALVWAADHARATGGSLHLLAAWEWPTFQGTPITYGRWDPATDCRARLARLRESADLPADRVSCEVLRGNAAHLLVDRGHDADLLVVGTHGMGAVSRVLLGSVSTYCATHSPVPVVIVRGRNPRARGVLVGVDDSDSARSALKWAMDYADLIRQRLTVVNVIEPLALPIGPGFPAAVTTSAPATVHREARRALRELVAKAEADRGRPVGMGVTVRVLDGHPAHVLAWESKRANVTVVGRHGAGGLHRLVVGSVASALAHHGESTVVLTPSV
ncbi:MAG TPA: universal stress protein [Mycobacteriales bacterium]|jgi:nucleotide-binding universal stress UspA family protein|nr:universal stress protein [Mycobacteriales bacterium]